ncbi:MAG: hypothetical protein KatS3mg014_2759 [Actinomycetota bacterium]|nr:MAG: hypothetical protein KatS3mg014_2759 [Actinomycetota bacterium]
MLACAILAAACTGAAGEQSAGGPRVPPSATGNPDGRPPRRSRGGPETRLDRAREKLEHLVFIVQENRSFDHYFGTFPGAEGIPMGKDGEPKVCVPDPVLDRCVPPYHDPTLVQQGGPHGQRHSDLDVHGGRMDGFIRTLVAGPNACADDRSLRACRDDLGPEGQPDVMGYHDAREIPNYWAYAERFVLQDHLFAPADSVDAPGRTSTWVSAVGRRGASDPARPRCRADRTSAWRTWSTSSGTGRTRRCTPGRRSRTC